MVILLVSLSLLCFPARGWADDEVSPETKALLSKLHDDMKSKTPKVRAAAYTAVGELGEKATGERRVLCEGLLDPSPAVQTAAADALKKVDEPLSKVALDLIINKTIPTSKWVTDNPKQAKALIPLLVALAAKEAPTATKQDDFSTEVRIARGQLSTAVKRMVAADPEDPVVNQSVLSMLGNPIAELRATALSQVPAVKNKKLALKQTLGIAANPKETVETRIFALNALPELVDENTRAAVYKSVEGVRFDENAKVRDAVSEALTKLQK
ncbi:MAG: HEAT repeat domain-containing protein [Armatimonadaceae bacterium]